MTMAPVIEREATFSDCRRWRYLLRRTWDRSLPALNVVGLNPSTADETLDDPTIRRCIGYARDWGFGGLLMTNIFAWRATDPRDMKAAAEPVGECNAEFLFDTALSAGLVLAAWGVHGAHLDRDQAVMKLLERARQRKPPVYCLGETAGGHPRHPLYLPRTAERRVYEGRAV